MLPAPSHTAASSDTASTRWLSWCFWMLLALLLPLMLQASLDFGTTWDEGDRHRNGEAIVQYYQGLRSREDAHYGTMYPGLFDVVPAWLEQHLATDRYVLRHRVNAVFGWVGLVFTGLLARRLFGPWSGLLAVLLLALSPRYFAASMNNPKDLPFGAMGMVALYGMSRLSPQWPFVRLGTGAGIAVGLGLALATRPGGLLLFGYLLLLVCAFVVVHRTTAAGDTLVIDRRMDWKATADSVARLGAVLVAALLIATVFWPWAQASPVTRPFEALGRASNYPWDGHVLFAGTETLASELPWSYLPTWFAIATPPVVLVGLICGIVVHVRGWGWPRLAVAGAALLPIVLIIVRNSTVYDGLRHVLFTYPPMVVVAASGWAGLQALRHRWLRVGGVVLLAAGLLDIASFNVRSYPNQAVYFNELVGGPRGAFARYELDYWGNCVLQAVEWSAGAARRAGMPVSVVGSPRHLVEANAARFPAVAMAPDERYPHHLMIRLLRGSSEDVRALAARDDAVHHVTTADGAVLCAVFPGSDFDALHRRLQAFDRAGS